MKQFEDKIVVVTGGNSGIGRAAAIQFAAGGAKVAILARNEQTGRGVVEEICAAGGVATFYQADVSVEAQVEEVHQAILRDYGQFHASFNNAGISGGGQQFHELDTVTFDQIMKTNAYSTFWCMRAQIKHFLDSKTRGAIVNCASVAGVLGRRYMGGYVASKHAVVGLTRAAALDTAVHGIRVNAICPGATKTTTLEAFFDTVSPEEQAKILDEVPRGIMASCDEVASLAVYLCSDLAANITGQAILSDGGISVG